MKRIPYREAIGALTYLAVGTRPDVSFAVSTLSQFLGSTGEVHWKAVKWRISLYLIGTKSCKRTYGTCSMDLDADGTSLKDAAATSEWIRAHWQEARALGRQRGRPGMPVVD